MEDGIYLALLYLEIDLLNTTRSGCMIGNIYQPVTTELVPKAEGSALVQDSSRQNAILLPVLAHS